MKSLHLSMPHIIATVGMPGAGKTQFSEKFAETFGAPMLASDKLSNLSENKKLAQSTTVELLQEFMKTKQTIVYDGATEKRVDRAELVHMAREAGYKVLFVWVQTDLATAQSRWTKSRHGDESKFEQLMRQFSAPHESESYVVISGRHTYSAQAKTVLRKLTESRAVAASAPTTPRTAVSNRIRVE